MNTYDDAANTITTTDADGNATVTYYDAVGRPIQVMDAHNQSVFSVYDGIDLVRQTDRNLNVTRYSYDADNRLIEAEEDGTTGAAITTTAEEYHDAQKQVVDVGPRSVGGEPIRTIHQNDSLGREVSLSVQNES